MRLAAHDRADGLGASVGVLKGIGVMRLGWVGPVIAGGFFAAVALATPALAVPSYTFTSTSGGGSIVISQVATNQVEVVFTPASSSVGIVNTGSHIPFAFDLSSGTSGLSIKFNNPDFIPLTPTIGDYFSSSFNYGQFTLATGSFSQPGGAGNFNVEIADSLSGGNNIYKGTLDFTLTQTGLTIDDFVLDAANGEYFTADLSVDGATGAQFFTKVPEPMTLSLFGAGLAGLAALRRRKAQKA